MSYWSLLGACISLYVLLNFAVLPALKRRWIATRSLAKIGKAGVLVGLTTLRNVAFIATVTYLAFAAVVVMLRLANGDARFLTRVVGWASALHDRLRVFSALVETWFFILPAALLVYLSWHRMRREWRDRFAERVLDEMDRLNAERLADPRAWASEAESDEMRALADEIAAVRASISTAGSPADRDARARLARRIALLEGRRRALDYERRVNLDPLHQAVDEPPASGWRGWKSVLLTRGFFSDAQTLTKILSRATLVTLTVALIGFGTRAGLLAEVRETIVSLDDLRVERTKEHAPKPLPPAPQDEPPPPPQDASAVEHLAREFARALARNPHWRGLRPALTLPRDAERQLARRAILNQARLPNAEGKLAAHPVRDAAPLSLIERQIVDDLAPTSARARPRVAAAVAEQRGGTIVRWFGSRWHEARRSILDHAALYRQPVGAVELQDALVDRILSSVVDEAVPEAGNEIGKRARSAFNAATKAAIKEGIDLEFRTMLDDLANGTPLDDALRRVASRPVAVSMRHVEHVASLLDESRVPAQELPRKLAPEQTAWRAAEAVPRADRPARPGLENVVDDIARVATENGRYSLGETAIEALAEYDDHFPRTATTQSRTAFGQALERHLRPADRQAFQRVAIVKANRARSFSMLRGFSRIGGVLIGAEAENPREVLDLGDIDWKVQANRTTLLLKTASGKRVEMGPYDAALVHQALAYAADGRPVAVTMTTANPLPQLKIHLHPALLDTPLGCHAIELDRLVDTYAGEALPRRKELEDWYKRQESLYRFAWGSRIKSFNAPATSPLREAGERLVLEGQLAASVRQALAAFSEADGPGSTFRRKPEFFDPDLVDAMRACAPHREPTQFGECIQARFSGRMDELRDDSKSRRWLAAPASFQAWSGVRERPFEVSADFQFVRDQRGAVDLLHPFRFMVQLAFTSPAVAAENGDEYVDEHPLEFDEIEGRIQDLVRAGVTEDSLTSMLADLRSFTLLQRLFRVLLDGQGGSEFPLRKLASLGEATAGSVKYVHTPRWNGSMVMRFQYLLVQSLATAPRPSDPAWTSAARAAGARCLRLLGAATSTRLPEEWSRECNFEPIAEAATVACVTIDRARSSPSCTWASAAQMAPDMPRMYRYEQAFGVIDDLAGHAESSCDLLKPSAVSP
jgi:hypothetical protein